MKKKNLFPFTIYVCSILILSSVATRLEAQQIIAYYSGSAKQIKTYYNPRITEIIFSFCHLKGNRLSVDNKKDTQAIRALVSLKKKIPD